MGWVYAVRNLEFVRPLIKIGMSGRAPHLRVRELASTGVPGDYQLVYCVHTVNARFVEARAHQALGQYRYQAGKEFFEAPIAEVVSVLDVIANALPIRMSQGRSGRYNERSNPLPQPFSTVVLDCPGCSQSNRVRALAIPVQATCGKCGAALPPLPGI